MRLCLIGYGQMGKAIESLALSSQHKIEAIVSPSLEYSSLRKLPRQLIQSLDAFIDFSVAGQAEESISFAQTHNIPLIIGTTGFEIDTMLLKKSPSAIFYAPNFSIGVNLYYELSQIAGKLIRNLDQFDIALREVHHRKKVDSPSGTALSLSEQLLSETKKSHTLTSSPNGPIALDELHVTSTRLGSVIGIHETLISSPYDLIELKHTSMSREAYAKGALLAASWVQGKRGFYTFKDLLQEKLHA